MPAILRDSLPLFAEGKDMTCDDITGWRQAKDAVLSWAPLAEISVANFTAAAVQLMATQGTINGMMYAMQDYRMNPYDCPLGARTVRLMQELVSQDNMELGQRPFMPPTEEQNLLSNDMPSWVDVLRSGWPLFGVLDGILPVVLSKADYINIDAGCTVMLNSMVTKVRSGESLPCLAPDDFAELLRHHLKTRTEFLRLPREPIWKFWVHYKTAGKFYAYGAGCPVALAAASLALALVNAHPATRPTDNSTSDLGVAKLITEAEKLLRHWWGYWKTSPIKTSQSQNFIKQWTPVQQSLYIQRKCLQHYPIFTLLQHLQNVLHGRPGVSSVAIGLDLLPPSSVGLLRRGSTFWEERRAAFYREVFGTTVEEPRYSRPLTKIEELPSTSGLQQTALTWSLGLFNASALVTRALPATRKKGRGLVVLHPGHEGQAYDLYIESRRDYFKLARIFVDMGFDVITVCMPRVGYNQEGGWRPTVGAEAPDFHGIFEDLEKQGHKNLLSYFFGGVVLALDWAEKEMGHEHFAMVGHSGGAWATQVAAALEPRFSLSIPVPGATPSHLIDMRQWTQMDWEAQMNPKSVHEICSTLCILVLAVVGGGHRRWAAHFHHLREGHPMAFGIQGIEKEVQEYYETTLPQVIAPAGAAAGARALRLVLTNAEEHIVDWRDYALIETLVEKWAATWEDDGQPDFFEGEWPLPGDARWNGPAADFERARSRNAAKLALSMAEAQSEWFYHHFNH
eukprot:TRINITY_DN101221_c0_g1_i1.p1 TRINITY_DN101221_c0_g1~~TRINITY_DN101221_c0_g1_i1.p1  ORF type:complete len:795 (-),score=139.39 TRINITY_DN101221_c0_g1_i1:59-2266(-)